MEFKGEALTQSNGPGDAETLGVWEGFAVEARPGGNGTADHALPPLPGGTLTILLADVEGSVRHWEQDRDAAARAIARFDEIAAEAAARHKGVKPVEQGEGDAFILAFTSAADAVAAALDLQQVFDKEPWPGGAALRVRMALNSGELRVRSDGRYVGAPFNRAARLRALAHGGQTLLTRATHDLVIDVLPGGATLRDLGEHRLRDLSRPERVYQLCHPDLADDFPPIRSLSAVPNNLPVMLTSFIGRDVEMRELTSLLRQTRLVTLTGAGGCGKTRLAIQAAGELAGSYDDGAWWVELAPIADPDLVTGALAGILGVQDAGGPDPVGALAEKLRNRRLLIVLDNCEHLIDASATLAAALLHRCPGVSVLATSREPLGIEGEAAFRVPSLPVPETDPSSVDELAPFAAARLFVERAARARPNYRAADEHAPAVAQICRRLDGIPLAIELAAARVRMMSPTQIVEALSDRFHLLTGGARTALPRQRTLEASVDWSFHLLAEHERRVLGRVSVFAGSFDLDAAEDVCGFDGIERYAVLDLLRGLVDRSLVQADDSPEGTRYRLLETIRAYARQKVADAGDAPEVRTRHLDHFVALAERAEPELQGATIATWLDRLDAESGNLRAAMDWALTSGQSEKHLRIWGSIGMFWLVRAQYGEMQRVVDAGLEAAPDADPLVRVKALMGAISVWFQSDFRRCLAYAEEAARLAEGIGESVWLSRALMWRGWTHFFLGIEPGTADLEEAVRLAEEHGNPSSLSRALFFLGTVTAAAGDLSRGLKLIDDAVVRAREAGDPLMLGQGLFFLGLAHYIMGDMIATREFTTKAADIGRALRHGAFTAQPLVYLALATVRSGDSERGRALAEEAIRIATETRAFLAHGLAEAALAEIELGEGDAAAALARADNAAKIASSTGLVPNVAGAYLVAGRAARHLDAFDRAAAALEAAKDAARLFPFGVGSAVLETAWLRRAQGDRAEAERLAHDALPILAGAGGAGGVADCLELLGTLAFEAQSAREAVRLLGAASAIRDAHGIVLFSIDVPDHEAALAGCGRALGEDDFATAWGEGTAMTLEEAVAYAERGRGERKRPSAGWESLTPTEIDVVRLAAQGLSNPQIAERLLISRHTVKVHLSHVFAKLGISSRAELAAEATRRGM